MKKTSIWTAFIIVALSFVIAFMVLPSLPEQIPIHWNFNGEIDKYSDKYSVFMFPVIILVIVIIQIVTPRVDPKKKNYLKFSKTYDQMFILIVLFLFGVYLFTVYSAFDPEAIKINVVIPMAVGLLFCFMGNLMPRLRNNFYVGIRTSWTLSNEQVWFKTHRLAGKIWFIGGIILMISPFLPKTLMMIVLIFDLAILIIAPIVYSYVIFQNIKKGERI